MASRCLTTSVRVVHLYLQPRLSSSVAVANLKETSGKKLDSIAAAGTWKTERVITSPQSAAIHVQGSDGKMLNFCANNYLGLSVSSQFTSVVKLKYMTCTLSYIL